MKKKIGCAIIFFLFCWAPLCLADVPPIALEAPHDNPNTMASIQRGAKFFATNCMVCHTLVYVRYNPLAAKAGITYEKMPVNVTTWPNNVKPPDLSLIADVRGTAWIYTYLHSFYKDPSRPTGFNNLVLPNTAMPDILAPYQGQQVLATDVPLIQDNFRATLQWYDVLTLQQQGSMSPAEFDATITDVVNFLSYAAHPYQAEQHRLGKWVLGFLIVLFILMYFLKKSYWQDLKKRPTGPHEHHKSEE